MLIAKGNLYKVFFLFVLGLVMVLIIPYAIIHWNTKEMHTSDISKITPSKTGLVLGTSKGLRGGGKNLFFYNRMQAVKELFVAHKIEYVIVSGDNALIEYNETRDMKKALLDLGIPEKCIITDYAGFRTLDSVIRAKEVFGQDSIIIISQAFHNERALFIAKNHNIKAMGYDAQTIPLAYAYKVYAREFLARIKCLLDIYILNTMPKFYKEKESFPS